MSIDKDTRIEGLKSFYDVMKHLTTLCTGTLVLLVSLVEKIFPPGAKSKFLFPVAMIVLLLSVFSALLCMLYISEVIMHNKHAERRINVINGTYLTSFICFFVGLLTLVVFSVLNY